jgi:hypothetical protein
MRRCRESRLTRINIEHLVFLVEPFSDTRPSVPSYACEDPAMAKDKEPFQSLTGMAEQLADHSMGKAQGAMKNYFGWLQSAMSAAPWGNTDLNKKLLDYAAENSEAVFEFVQKLTKAKNLEDVVLIQTEFMSAQLKSLNEQAKGIGDAYTKTVGAVTKAPFGTST